MLAVANTPEFVALIAVATDSADEVPLAVPPTFDRPSATNVIVLPLILKRLPFAYAALEALENVLSV